MPNSQQLAVIGWATDQRWTGRWCPAKKR